MMRCWILWISICCFFLQGLCQEKYVYCIQKAQDKIILDGKITEKSWEVAQKATDFWQSFPYDTSYCKSKTVAMMTYDEEFLYVGAICYDSLQGEYVVQSLKRDFSYPRTDAFAVYLDPLCDKTNGFNFTVSPYNVQREGILNDGGSMGVTTSWDNKWYSQTCIELGKWTVEMAIPFKTLRYKTDRKIWRVNFSRNDLKRNENGAWHPVPRQFNIAHLAYTGVLEWDSYPPPPGMNVVLIPYAIARAEQDYQNKIPLQTKPNTGLDAKVGITPSLNLDLTFNPDFSQVEVDRQVTNLSRFTLFFPERRNFFLENSDLFERFGFSKIRPFFSRNIGLYNGKVVPIIAGARLSGKVNQNWRIGAMSMQTEGVRELQLSSYNYSVFAVQRKVFERSNIAAILVNKQSVQGSEIQYAQYNRLAGIDYNLASKDGKWQGKLFYHHTFSPNNKSRDQNAHASWIMYNTRKVQAHWNHEFVGNNYNAEVGFVPRKNYVRLEPMVYVYFYPKSRWVNNFNFGLYTDMYFDRKGNFLDRIIRLSHVTNFQSSAHVDVSLEDIYTYLFFPFDPSGTNSKPLPIGGYYYKQANVSFTSNFRKTFSYSVLSTYGTYFIGHKWTSTAEVNYRWQPYAAFGLKADFNQITLPKPYTSADLVLIGTTIEITFTNNLFFTTFLQYNTQINNMNINSRLQWRFKPMSDLFIVYTDNYATHNLAVKNRALVIKLTYWLNV
ncbi:MAG: carbohydrate binding family 9 domain-containing protein [Bacteroidia bacterium]|nr:carbohydrate binding family 9 domain-containing protein [Bacteroidia bacterium]MDW8302746.1 DUF5916 domain-containing protein [Bacteroidia bacterium]